MKITLDMVPFQKIKSFIGSDGVEKEFVSYSTVINDKSYFLNGIGLEYLKKGDSIEGEIIDRGNYKIFKIKNDPDIKIKTDKDTVVNDSIEMMLGKYQKERNEIMSELELIVSLLHTLIDKDNNTKEIPEESADDDDSLPF